MRYKYPSGRLFTLAAHTPTEWGQVQADKLRHLNCSDEYAQAVADEYAASVPAPFEDQT